MSIIRYPNIASRIFNTPLLITPDKLDAIIAGLSGRIGIHSVAAPQAFVSAKAEKKEPGYSVIRGVAVINVFGVLVHRSRMEADSSYLLGYDSVAAWFDDALADSDVHSIVLNIDSPGGEVAGCFDLVQKIRDARGTKPIHSVASDQSCSAAYAIASAADSVSVTRTAMVGSIGVVTRHVDFSKLMEQDGIKVTYIYAGAQKIDGNPFEPLPPAVRARFQTDIDSLYELFVNTVSENRNLSEEHVRGTEAGVFTGEAGVAAQLADQVETPDQLIQRLSVEGGQSNSTRALAAHHQEEILMSVEDKNKPTAAASGTADETALEAMRAEGVAEGQGNLETAVVEARADERSRIQAIVTSDSASGRNEMAHHLAFATDMDAKQAQALLDKSPKATPAGSDVFSAAMIAAGNPDLGADDGGDGNDAAAEANKIVGMLNG